MEKYSTNVAVYIKLPYTFHSNSSSLPYKVMPSQPYSINSWTIIFLFGSTFSIIRKSIYANFSDMHHIPRKMSYNYHAIAVTFTFHLQIVVRWMLLDINDRVVTSFFFGTLILIFLFQISSVNIEIDVESFD